MASSSKQMDWTDAHFCGLRSQSNVYGLSKVTLHDGLTRLLAVSINSHYVTVEYQKSFDNRLIPITREEEFFMASPLHGPVGPGDLEIVSVDMICQDGDTEKIVLGITYLCKLTESYEDKGPCAYMTVYFLSAKQDAQFNLVDALATARQSQIQLDYIPLKLMHHEVDLGEGRSETCFLLSGTDSKIHVLRLDPNIPDFYEDQKISAVYFPEFAEVHECVTQMEFRQLDISHRLSAIGTQSGAVAVYLINTVTHELERQWETDMDSPITSIQLFSHQVLAPPPHFLENEASSTTENTRDESQVDGAVNLLITSAIDPAIVFWDVMENDLNKRYVLPLSNSQDVILCSGIMDIDFDGENEILIGTYGQVLLAYKLCPDRTPSVMMTSTPFQSPRPVPIVSGSSGKPEPSGSPGVGEERSSTGEQTQSDRRRHKSLAGTIDSGISPSKHDKAHHHHHQHLHQHHRGDDSSLLDGGQGLRDAQLARLVRSQENLASASPRSVYFQTPEHSDSFESLPHGSLPDLSDTTSYRLKWTKRFSNPVMGLICEDMMGDGMLDLVVLTLKGLHILQPDLNEVAGLLLERLRLVCQQKEVDQTADQSEDQHYTRSRTGAIIVHGEDQPH